MLKFLDLFIIIIYFFASSSSSSNRYGRLENVGCRGQEQKVLHSSVECASFLTWTGCDLCEISVSMEKDNNLDFFPLSFSDLPMPWMEWLIELQCFIPGQSSSRLKMLQTHIHTSIRLHATPWKSDFPVITIPPHFYIITSILIHLLRESLRLLPMLHFCNFIMCLSGCVVVQ